MTALDRITLVHVRIWWNEAQCEHWTKTVCSKGRFVSVSPLFSMHKDQFAATAMSVTEFHTYLANPIKSSWFVFIYASWTSTSKMSWSLAFCSRSRIRVLTIRSVSSRSWGKRAIWSQTLNNWYTPSCRTATSGLNYIKETIHQHDVLFFYKAMVLWTIDPRTPWTKDSPIRLLLLSRTAAV